MQGRTPPVGPAHFHQVDYDRLPQPEVKHRTNGRLKSPGQRQFPPLRLTARFDPHLRPQSQGVSICPPQRHTQVVIPASIIVPVDRRRLVDIINHVIQISVVIQVGISRPVGERALVYAPVFDYVGERQVPIVPVNVVADLLRRNPVDLLLGEGHAPELIARLQFEEVVAVIDVAPRSVGNQQVLPAVVIQVAKENRPAPVGGGNARQAGDLAKLWVTAVVVAPVELQTVLHILMVQSRIDHALKAAGIHAGHIRLGPPVVLRGHVHLSDIGETVVIVVGNISAHTILSGVVDGGPGNLPKRTVLVVEVEIIRGVKVIGDVEIRPAVTVDVSGRSAEGEAEVEHPGGSRNVAEAAVAVVAVEPVGFGQRGVFFLVAVERYRAFEGRRGVVGHVDVEVAVPVVVEKGSVGGIARVGQAVGGGGLGKGQVPVVDVQ